MPRVVKSPTAEALRILREAWIRLCDMGSTPVLQGQSPPAAQNALLSHIVHLSRPNGIGGDTEKRAPVPATWESGKRLRPAILPLKLHLLSALMRLCDNHRWTIVALGPVIGGAFWLSQWPAPALIAVIGLPFLALMVPSLEEREHLFAPSVDTTPNRMLLERRLDRNLSHAARGYQTGLLLLQIDRFVRLTADQDDETVERLLRLCGDRLRSVLRDGDLALRLEGPNFAVALSPTKRLDMEACLQLAGRLQRAIGATTAPMAGHPHISASVGFVLAARLQNPDPESLLQAARMALSEALRAGPASIRSYSPAMAERVTARHDLAARVEQAISAGEIIAFFQPQMSTRTGALTGFEALARWHHPERGLIPPAEFLPALQQAGLMPLLGRHILSEACAALHHWDATGLHVPHVGVNFSTGELSDPDLPARLSQEIEKFGLTPDRICVEVLETVVAQGDDDIILQNLAKLAEMGCRLDLDDFGTGHASITNIRRFAIARIKIDRSFVTRVDHDTEQQNMMAAILTMAERLDLDTLAEGVETPEELARLTQMGCGHVQGFAIARPMPLLEATAWQIQHQDRRAKAPIMRREAV